MVRWSCEHQTQYLASVSLLLIFPAVETNSNTQVSRLLLYSSDSSRRINPPANQEIHLICILYICPPVLKRGSMTLLLNTVEDVTAANVTLLFCTLFFCFCFFKSFYKSTYLLSVSALHLGDRSSKDLVNFTT